VFPGNGKSKTLPVQKVYFIHFTTPGTNEEDCPQNWRARQGIQYSSFQHKIEGIKSAQFPEIITEGVCFHGQVGEHPQDYRIIVRSTLVTYSFFAMTLKQ